MPIYAYRCSTCGHAQDVLQRMSDPLLTVCPTCGAATYVKQLTAAGFQLKGSGWYVTDFKDGGKKEAAKPDDKAADQPADAAAAPAADAKPADKTTPADAKADAKTADKAGGKPAGGAPSPAAAPAPAAPAAPSAGS